MDDIKCWDCATLNFELFFSWLNQQKYKTNTAIIYLSVLFIFNLLGAFWFTADDEPSNFFPILDFIFPKLFGVSIATFFFLNCSASELSFCLLARYLLPGLLSMIWWRYWFFFTAKVKNNGSNICLSVHLLADWLLPSFQMQARNWTVPCFDMGIKHFFNLDDLYHKRE